LEFRLQPASVSQFKTTAHFTTIEYTLMDRKRQNDNHLSRERQAADDGN